MKYKCKKCGELYETMPEECDFDDSREFYETEICQGCGEYKELYGNYCIDCIEEGYTPRAGIDYIKYMDKKRTDWGLEPFYEEEYRYLKEKEKGNEGFLKEYCLKDPEGFAEFIFAPQKRR